jgi:enoyl-CoA hydratase
MGTDIRQFTSSAAARKAGRTGLAYGERIGRAVQRLEAVRIPTIAPIDGYAVGGGVSIRTSAKLASLVRPGHARIIPLRRTNGQAKT